MTLHSPPSTLTPRSTGRATASPEAPRDRLAHGTRRTRPHRLHRRATERARGDARALRRNPDDRSRRRAARLLRPRRAPTGWPIADGLAGARGWRRLGGAPRLLPRRMGRVAGAGSRPGPRATSSASHQDGCPAFTLAPGNALGARPARPPPDGREGSDRGPLHSDTLHAGALVADLE
jgi:hypothetical protein